MYMYILMDETMFITITGLFLTPEPNTPNTKDRVFFSGIVKSDW